MTTVGSEGAEDKCKKATTDDWPWSLCWEEGSEDMKYVTGGEKMVGSHKWGP